MPSKKDGQAGAPPHPLGTVVYNTKQVADSLNVSVRSILRAIEKGQLEARMTGREYLMTAEAVRAYWESLPVVTKSTRRQRKAK